MSDVISDKEYELYKLKESLAHMGKTFSVLSDQAEDLISAKEAIIHFEEHLSDICVELGELTRDLVNLCIPDERTHYYRKWLNI